MSTTASTYIAAIRRNAPLLDVFMVKVAPFHERLVLNHRRNRRLPGLRDTLLPALRSGAIELPGAETIVKEIGEIIAGTPPWALRECRVCCGRI